MARSDQRKADAGRSGAPAPVPVSATAPLEREDLPYGVAKLGDVWEAQNPAHMPAPPADLLRCRVVGGNLAALGVSLEGHERVEWRPGDEGDFDLETIEAAGHCLVLVEG